MEIWYPGLINLGSFLPIYCAPLLQLSINRESASFLERKLVDPPLLASGFPLLHLSHNGSIASRTSACALLYSKGLRSIALAESEVVHKGCNTADI